MISKAPTPRKSIGCRRVLKNSEASILPPRPVSIHCRRAASAVRSAPPVPCCIRQCFPLHRLRSSPRNSSTETCRTARCPLWRPPAHPRGRTVCPRALKSLSARLCGRVCGQTSSMSHELRAYSTFQERLSKLQACLRSVRTPRSQPCVLRTTLGFQERCFRKAFQGCPWPVPHPRHPVCSPHFARHRFGRRIGRQRTRQALSSDGFVGIVFGSSKAPHK